MSDTMSESQLLQASAAGSKEAFGAVVSRYQALVCAVTYSATGDVGKSEELAQETFLRAWRSLRQLEDPGKFRAWLCAIARNLARTSLRGERKETARPLEAVAGLPASEPGPAEVILTKERQEMVWAVMERVPPRYREPLVLFYRHQQSVGEVATDLGLAEDTVRQRLHRGRQLIKNEVSSLVEETLARSGPGRGFAVAVIAALPALVTPSASAAVIGVVAKSSPGAKTFATVGLAGAILGPVLGLLGGLFGVWISIKTDSPRERRFMGRLALIWWLLFLLFVAVPLTLVLTELIATWVLGASLATFFVAQLPLFLWGKAGQRRIQNEDWVAYPLGVNRQSLYGGVAGGIFGATGWLLYQGVVAQHWVGLAALLVVDVPLFLAITRVALRKLRRD